MWWFSVESYPLGWPAERNKANYSPRRTTTNTSKHPHTPFQPFRPWPLPTKPGTPGLLSRTCLEPDKETQSPVLRTCKHQRLEIVIALSKGPIRQSQVCLMADFRLNITLKRMCAEMEGAGRAHIARPYLFSSLDHSPKHTRHGLAHPSFARGSGVFGGPKQKMSSL